MSTRIHGHLDSGSQVSVRMCMCVCVRESSFTLNFSVQCVFVDECTITVDIVYMLHFCRVTMKIFS